MSLLLTISYPLSCLITVGGLVLAIACLGIVAWRCNFVRGSSQPTRALCLAGLWGALLLCFWLGVVNFQIFAETNQVMHERASLEQKISDLEAQRLSLVKGWSAACDESARIKQETETAKLRVAELERQVKAMAAVEMENQSKIEQISAMRQKLFEVQEGERLYSQLYEEFDRTRHALKDQLEHKITQTNNLRHEVEEKALREP
jgi:hypothetical protein